MADPLVETGQSCTFSKRLEPCGSVRFCALKHLHQMWVGYLKRGKQSTIVLGQFGHRFPPNWERHIWVPAFAGTNGERFELKTPWAAQRGSRPAEPPHDGAAHYPVLVVLGEERQLLGEMRDALLIGEVREAIDAGGE